MIRPSAQVRATIQRTTPPLLIVLAAAIILVGKADQAMFDSLRIRLTDDAAPALDALSRPLAAAGGAGRPGARRRRRCIRKICGSTEENSELLQWQQVALKLSGENRELRGLLKVVPENAVSYVTARVIANSGGGYVRTVMVNAGSEQGLARGQAAITGAGLIGRLTEVGSRAARVLLITDLNSRIPVVVEGVADQRDAGRRQFRPAAAGLSRASPKRVKIGDRIVTSGEGGVFPPGLPVGVVAAIDPDGARVEPYVELSQLDHVLMVDYGLAGGLPLPAPAGPARNGRAKDAAADDRGRAERWRSSSPASPSMPRVNWGLARFLPTATVVVAAVISLLPLPIPGYAALTPAFTLMAVYHWSVYRPDLLPPSGLFAIGFAQDLVSGAALPDGALALLLARAAVLRYRRPLRQPALSVCLGRVRRACGGGHRRAVGAALRVAAQSVRSADRNHPRRPDGRAVPGGQPGPGAQSARADGRVGMMRCALGPLPCLAMSNATRC